MEPPLYYSKPEAINDDLIELGVKESHHAVRVMHHKRGDLIIVVDGLGNAYRGEIIQINHNKQVRIKVHSVVRNFGEPNIILTLAGGLSTGTKFNTIIEKGTELGVKRFVPLLTEKSRIKLDDPKKSKAKIARYENITLAAIKQCRRSCLPEISAPISFEKYMQEIDVNDLSLIFHPSRYSRPLSDAIKSTEVRRINIIIGPESGFSENEIISAKERGVKPISLGSRILRTETAGPVTCALIMNIFNELR
ncbi:MAG: RsmE family RNA methyltransferase [Candidatus Zixiibacteriota bacterium]